MIPFEGVKISHTEGAAQILKCRGVANPRDEFENNLLLTLRGSVVRAAEPSPFVCKLISPDCRSIVKRQNPIHRAAMERSGYKPA